ncbi:MAG: intradiol ring-cleavage dioxygenase [Candidatus Thiodiazotropha endolucinida]|nr:intradiol ring-cleavage dioxygenase [Candidatus Thiodiazotropha sp. (ex Codakia orbicularis)]MCG7861737.1 intradiol ring-cleavage dioxygenase [Candidatus Thiodiazotropha endolucinida]
MRNLNEQNMTQAVLATLENCEDLRLKQVMTAFIGHLHDFIRDLEPTEEEWFKAIQFLLDTAGMCDDKRNEFILLSDTLGATILVDAINHRKSEGATETSVLGPFYVEGAPEYPNGADMRGEITEGVQGESVVVLGKVTDTQGKPLAGAMLDIWETAPDGFYHVQKPGEVPEFNLCGKIRTDDDGVYQFCTYKPVAYPIPSDGPVGKLLRSMGRHFYRPAHIHVIVSNEGYEPVVTQLFTEGDDYLESDAVFGVKDSLVVDYLRTEGGSLAEQYDMVGQFCTVDYDFVLEKVKTA